jgi:3-hydroxyisobutyrate dehydrogenase-like beta-hydroxyacid dehydrogenase
MKVAFIGLGIMGSRMANNLLKHQVDLIVYNRSIQATQPLAAQGAQVANTPQEAVKEADIVFTMLASPQVVNTLAYGDQGFLQNMQSNAIWVDCSTVSPADSIASAQEAAKHGITFLEAPVAGTKPHAENAELVFFVGGESTPLEKVTPYINMMGKKVVHVGDVGKAASLKILINYLLAQGMLAFAEATIVGEKLGLERNFLLDFLPNLPVAAPFLKAKADNIKHNNNDVQFPLELMHKDLTLFGDTASSQGITGLSTDVSKSLYQEAMDKGLGREDFSAIYQSLLDKLTIKV